MIKHYVDGDVMIHGVNITMDEDVITVKDFQKRLKEMANTLISGLCNRNCEANLIATINLDKNEFTTIFRYGVEKFIDENTMLSLILDLTAKTYTIDCMDIPKFSFGVLNDSKLDELVSKIDKRLEEKKEEN